MTRALVGAAPAVRLIGGALLLVMAWRTWRAPVAEPGANAGTVGLLGAFGSTFALTIANPLTILSFVAVFAGLGLGSLSGRPGAGLLLVAGVVLGSGAWWLLLSGGVSLMRARFDARAMRAVNRVAAGIIGAFGALALGGGLLAGAH